MKLTAERVVIGVAVAGLIGAVLLAFGFRMTTPAGSLEEHATADSIEMERHVDDFRTHVGMFDDFLVRDEERDLSRESRTLQMDAQTRRTCLERGRDTLALIGLLDACSELGIPR